MRRGGSVYVSTSGSILISVEAQQQMEHLETLDGSRISFIDSLNYQDFEMLHLRKIFSV
jgi:hypothetical protein